MKKSKVYFLKLNQIGEIGGIIPKFRGKLGLKCHFGEAGNDAYIPATIIKQIAATFKYPPLLETTVLYRSQRSKASTHIELAHDHGFDFADIDILDGEAGDDNFEVDLGLLSSKNNLKIAYLGANLENYQSLLVISHFKGHGTSGFGGAIKNLAMGFASRRGKLDMHSGVKHQVNEDNCTACGLCIKNCPVDAISINQKAKAYIDQKACISCSKCISVCPVSAIAIPWNSVGKDEFQGRLSEYALAVSSSKQCYYINFLMNIVPQCDCVGVKQARLTEDIGILLSSDPVAIDQASYDLVIKQYPEFESFSSENQLSHGAEIFLGERDYNLQKVDYL